MSDNSLERATKLKEEGNAYFRNNNFLKAIEIYTLSLSIKDHPDVYNNRAAAYMKAGKYDLALFDLENVLDFQSNQKALRRRIFALQSLNRNIDAQVALKEYLEKYKVESKELKALSMDIDQILETNLHKFNLLQLAPKDNDEVMVMLKEVPNGKYIVYDLEKEKSTVEAQLAAHPIEQILIYGVALNHELANLLNQIDSVYLKDSPSSKLKIYNVDFSLTPKGMFNKLFGQLMRPNSLSFFVVRGIDGCSFIRNVKNCGSKYVEVMPVEKATNPIEDMTEFIECIGSKAFDICPKPLLLRTNQHLFGLKIGDIVNKLHEAFQVKKVQITYRLVIFCRLRDVREWIQELFMRRELNEDDIIRVFDFVRTDSNTDSKPEEMINEYNKATKERFVVKIKKFATTEMEMFCMLDSNVKCDEFKVSVQICCEI